MFSFFRRSETEQNEKLERLYLAYRQRLYYIALQILHDPMKAEDAVQDAFLRVRDHLDQIHEEDSHKTTSFLIVIVKHIAIDYLRKEKKEIPVPIEELEDLKISERARAGEEFLDLEAAFYQLSYEQAEILRLKYVQSFSNAEIARILGVSRDCVRKRLSRARKRLTELTEKRADDASQNR